MKNTVQILSKRFKDFFYDSYTGWKKKRIAVFTGSSITCITLIAVVIMFWSTSNSGLLSDFNTNNESKLTTVPDILPDSPQDWQNSGNIENGNEDIHFIPGHSEVTTKLPDDEPFEGYGPPVFGDIEASGGLADDETSVENAEQYLGKYESWTTVTELYSTIRLATEKIQNNYLLSMDTALERGNWAVFTADAALVLLDAPAIGEQIRANMGLSAVAVWNELEPLYETLYFEIYECTSDDDLRKVANGETRQRAIELTSLFIEAVNNETANN